MNKEIWKQYISESVSRAYREHPEIKQKISISRTGRHYPKLSEARKKILEDKNKHPMYGKHHSEESKKKSSETHKKLKIYYGENNVSKRPEVREKLRIANIGRTHSEETKQKIRLLALSRPSNRKGIPIGLRPGQLEQLAEARKVARQKYPRGYWFGKKSTISREKVLERVEASLKGNRRWKVNKLELKLGSLISIACPREYKYTGNGKVIINGLCPDYTNRNGKKKVIEVFGDYWHNGENPQIKIDKYSEFGFDCLVIWEHELKEKSELELVKIIKEFNDD